MDSLGRRIYGVDERTYERELKTYFDRNFEDRVSERESIRKKGPGGKPMPKDEMEMTQKATDIANGGINILSQLTSILRLGILVFTFYMLYVAGKKFLEELEKAGSENNEQEGDVFDKMFGSEFKGKFKNARQNKGTFQRRQEEMRLRNEKDDNNTTSPTDIRKVLGGGEGLIGILERISTCSVEDFERGVFINELASNFSLVQVLFRLLYRGYTYRELLSPKVNKRGLLKEASSYVIHSL
ncbi:MAG: hypothetical protein FJ267_15565, partial [Planctomycetes bacterium]|nr:hypothetical protein [Planctomycetota bacterium]